MAALAVVIVPTAGRPAYLDVALASIGPQARAAGADVLVIDDGPTAETRIVAAQHGARYVAHGSGRGLNAARNTGIGASDAPLICFVDDDVEVHEGWLATLIAANAELADDVCVMTGPILARFDGVRRRTCGRESPPITHLDLGAADVDADHAWGANMTVRRQALDRFGLFDESLGLYGDEQEWQDRVRAGGGRIRYLAAAGLDHRRAGDDAQPRALAKAAYSRGRASRRFDRLQGRAPSLRNEVRVLAGCAFHGIRHRCANGPTMTAHSAGRLREAISERFGRDLPPAVAGRDDFLSGRSGIAAGRAATAMRALDCVADLRSLPMRPKRRTAARTLPTRTVLVVAAERTDTASILDAALTELSRSRHTVTAVSTTVTPGVGKFEHINALLREQNVGDFDWVLVIDDDVSLPSGFLDTFLAVAEAGKLELAQPAHRRHSHAAWPVTLRQSGSDWRETSFVEIGPLTAFSRTAAAELLPFPEGLGMGWGLDVHWSALAQANGWRIGVVDATPVAHTLRATASDYPRSEAASGARKFLDGKPYTPRGEVRTLAAYRLGDGS